LVAYAADGADEGAVGAVVDFAAEVVDVDVDDVGDGNRRSNPCLS
jgi:hypothetical protein